MKGDKIMGWLWICIAIVLSFILVTKLKSNNSKKMISFKGITSNNFIGNAELFETKTFSPKDVKSIDVQVSSESIYIEKTKDNKITVESYCTMETAPSVELYNNVIKIQENKAPVKISLGRKIIIKVPADFKSDEIEINTASGSIHVNDISTPVLDLRSASGSVHIEDCQADSIDAKTSSGSVHVKEITTKDLECNTTSGSIHIEGYIDGVEANAVSGSVHADLKKALTQKSSLQTTSGSIDVNMPEDSDVTIKYHVVSGTYKNNLTNTSGKTGTDIMGNGNNQLNLKTTSGSIKVQ